MDVMAVSLTIRKAVKTDMEIVFKVVNEAYRVTVGNTGDAFKTCNRFLNIDEVEQMLDILWVGELGSEIVGVVGIEVMSDQVNIGPLAVSKKCQKQGIGGKLLDKAEAQGVVASAQVMSLRSSVLAMYLNRGYQEVKEVPVVKFFTLHHQLDKDPLHRLSRHDLTVKYLQKKKNT